MIWQLEGDGPEAPASGLQTDVLRLRRPFLSLWFARGLCMSLSSGSGSIYLFCSPPQTCSGFHCALV